VRISRRRVQVRALHYTWLNKHVENTIYAPGEPDRNQTWDRQALASSPRPNYTQSARKGDDEARENYPSRVDRLHQ
jgi:hypothetical protein